MTRIVENFQTAYAALVQPNGGYTYLQGSNYYTWSGYWLPFTVPSNRWLIIKSAGFSSKFGGVGRSSYLEVLSCFTLQDNHPHFSAEPGFIVPPGQQVQARFWNNETMTPEGGGGEAQWMNMYMTGILVDNFAGTWWGNCLDGV